MKKNYFNSLNYTIGNEDTSLEFEILPENTQHIFTVAGSGSRIIPLLAKKPSYITCVDSSLEQLSLAELRIASLKLLDHKKFLAFWDYPSFLMSPNERQSIFNDVAMSKQSRESTRRLFEKHDWKSLLYMGKWERTFQKLSRFNRWIIGKKGTEIFACRTKEEQINYLKNKFPHRAWSLAIFLLGNAVVFNALLYKGNFPQKNIPQSMHKFYLKRFNHLFDQEVVRKNFFLQLLFLGKLQFSEGLPLECDETVFLKAKESLNKVQIRYVLKDILKEAKQVKMPIDFLSFSDVPSYLKPPQEQNFLQEIKKNISLNGIVVNRYYLHIPKNIKIDGYRNITMNHKEIIAKEKIQMYDFGIYQKI